VIRLRATIAMGSALCALLAPVPAHAQEDRKAAAEGLFDEGLKLFDAGRYPEACAKFEASQRLDPATGTLLNVARCLEKSGKTASAWATYREVQALAGREGDARRQQVAREREKVLEGHLSRLVIVVPADQAHVAIRRDGTAMDPAEWGVPVPVDPGPHEVEVSAPGKQTSKHTVVVGPEAQVTETVAPLEAVPPPRELPPVPVVPSAPASSSLQRALALAAGAVGLVGAGTGAYFGVDASSKWNDARNRCPAGGHCDAAGASLSQDAGAAADRATASFVVAGIALAAGVVLWLTAPSSSPVESGKTAVRITPAGPGAGTVGVEF
jgi:hypothetical protein